MKKPLTKRWPFLLLLYFFKPICCLGQSPNYSMPIDEQAYLEVAIFTEKDGLPHWDTNALFEDHRGLVWFQSGTLLCFYDGQSITPVEEKSDKLYHTTTITLGEDKTGNIWRLSSPADKHAPVIDIYSPALDRFFTAAEYVVGEKIPSFSNESQLFSVNQELYVADIACGSLWRFDDGFSLIAQTGSNTLVYPATNQGWWEIGDQATAKRFDKDGQLLADYSPLTPSESTYFLDRKKHLWTQGLSQPPLPRNLSTPGNLEEQVTDALIIPVISTPPGFFGSVFVPVGVGRVSGLPGIHSFHLWGNDLRASSSENRWQLPLTLLIFLNTGNSGSRPEFSTKVRTVRWLSDRSLLCVTDDGLVHLDIRKRYFRNYLPDYSIRGMALANDSNLLAVTHEFPNEKVWSYNLSTGEEKQVWSRFNNTKNTSPYSIYTTTRQFIIGASNGDILLYDRQWREQGGYAMPANDAWDRYETWGWYEAKSLRVISDSTYWYGTNDGLVEINTRTRESTIILPNVQVHWIHQDAEGAYWLGTDQGLYNWENKVFYLNQLVKTGTPADVSHIYEDPRGVLWLASKQGLIKWPKFTTSYQLFDQESGLPSGIVHAVYPDLQGRLWLSTNDGIAAFDTAAQVFTVYQEGDGIVNNEQNFSSHLQRTDGYLFFGGIKGVTAFHPDSIPRTKLTNGGEVTPIRLYAFDKQGKELARVSTSDLESGHLQLPRGTARIRSKIVFTNTFPENLELQWRVSQDEKWQTLDPENDLFLPLVPLGNFTLELRMKSPKSKESYSKTTLHLYIPFPIYYYWWFWAFVGIALALGVYWVVQLRSKALAQANDQLNDLVKQRTIELNNQTQQLKHAYDLKNKLFKNISHELRTPLTIISVAAEQELEKSGKTKNLTLIRQKTQGLNKMFDEILDLGQLDLGLVSVNKQAVEWTTFVRTCISSFAGLAAQKHIAYERIVTPSHPVYLLIDKSKVETVLNNFIDNAIKYTPSGGRIIVKSTFADGLIHILVADSGPGIPEQEQQDIFKRYYRSIEATHSSTSGYGIGLSLSRQYVELLGGEIGLDSTPGEGALFFADIPAEEVQPTAQEETVAKKAKTQTDQKNSVSGLLAQETHGYLLIVEDNPELLTQLEEFFSKRYRVDTATNGQEAWAKIQENGANYDLVLSDVMMPVMDGFSLLEKTRTNNVSAFLPFLLLTALGSEDQKLKALRLGVDAYVVKPFSLEEISIQVQNLVNKQRQRKQHINGSTPGTEKSSSPPTEHLVEPLTGYDHKWLKEIEDIVTTNLARTDFKITDIAHQMHISERTLRNLVKKYTGHSPRSYLQNVRLDSAYRYLEQRKYQTVKEVAYAVGFKDPQYFSTLFKKKFGRLPSDYQ